MSKMQLIVTLMSVVAIIIVGLAAYIFTHLSGIDMTQGIILIVIAIIALFLVMVVIFLFLRSINVKK